MSAAASLRAKAQALEAFHDTCHALALEALAADAGSDHQANTAYVLLQYIAGTISQEQIDELLFSDDEDPPAPVLAGVG